MIHPSSIDLEAFACGDEIASVEPHLADCESCRHFVEKAGTLAKTAESDADDVLARALASIELPANDHAPPAVPPKRSFWFVASTIVTPLAAAAAVLLLTRSAPLPQPTPTPSPPSAPSTASPSEISPPSVASAPTTTFKGSVQIAVVRERDGDQARFLGAVQVRSGDRLRVEVALDREQAILGAVIADDGSYLEIMPLGVRGRGTHHSEKSARIDATPTAGTIVIGTPEAVLRARAARRFEGVITLRVEPEGAVP